MKKNFVSPEIEIIDFVFENSIADTDVSTPVVETGDSVKEDW